MIGSFVAVFDDSAPVVHHFVVPPGCTSVRVTVAVGALCTIPVSPFDVLDVYVGMPAAAGPGGGGWPDGGDSGGTGSLGGQGSTRIERAGVILFQVGGYGGNSSLAGFGLGGQGGVPGTPDGGDGDSGIVAGYEGHGGTTTAGGAAGPGGSTITATAGAFQAGGQGGKGTSGVGNEYEGGGGGGGYYGGGGGGVDDTEPGFTPPGTGGGGGGGSSYADPTVTDVVFGATSFTSFVRFDFDADVPPLVWATMFNAEADMWWEGDGSATSIVTIEPPDGDAFNPSTSFPAWYAGGSDGTYNYHADISGGGEWFAAQFDALEASRRTRWRVSDWTATEHQPNTDIQHLSADSKNVVVIADYNDGSTQRTDVAVFDTEGSLLNVWTHDQLPEPISGLAPTLSSATGSFTKNGVVFFAVDDPDLASPVFYSVDLATGAWTELFVLDDLNTQIAAAYSGANLGTNAGLVKVGQSLIIAGSQGVVRVKLDGTLQWFYPNTRGAPNYRGMALSGRASVWASTDTITEADEFKYDGTFVQTIEIPEVTVQAWLGPAPRSKWHLDAMYW